MRRIVVEKRTGTVELSTVCKHTVILIILILILVLLIDCYPYFLVWRLIENIVVQLTIMNERALI